VRCCVYGFVLSGSEIDSYCFPLAERNLSVESIFMKTDEARVSAICADSGVAPKVLTVFSDTGRRLYFEFRISLCGSYWIREFARWRNTSSTRSGLFTFKCSIYPSKANRRASLAPERICCHFAAAKRRCIGTSDRESSDEIFGCSASTFR
jgi:hypothetical protein